MNLLKHLELRAQNGCVIAGKLHPIRQSKCHTKLKEEEGRREEKQEQTLLSRLPVFTPSSAAEQLSGLGLE